MQACGRFVEDIERIAALPALQFRRKLDALCLATRELGCRLAESQVSQPHLLQYVQGSAGLRIVGEEFGSCVHGHPEDFGDILAAVLDLQRLRVVARAMAGRARRVNAGEKEQLNHHEAFSLAGLAAALCNIEGETSGAVATRPRFLGRGKQVAYVVEQSRVGGTVRPRRTP